MERERKKKPTDYPVFGYRLVASEHERLTELLEEVHELFNKSLSKDHKPYAKNEIFVSALEKGLAILKQKKLAERKK